MATSNKNEMEQEKEPLKLETIILPIAQNNSLLRKKCYITNVTVEPVIAAYVMTSFISRMAVQNLNLEKVCRVSKNYGDKICDSLIGVNNNTTEYEAEIQKNISEIEAWRTPISAVLPLIILIYMGAWSDRSGNRKICILLPIVGEFFVNISNIMSSFFFNAVSAEVTMFLEVFFPAVTGGFWLLVLGMHSYITDITDDVNRTFRVGLATICISASGPAGTALSGVLMNLMGYYGVFFINAFINLTTFLYGYMVLNNKTIDNGQVQKSITISDLIIMQKETALVLFQRREGNTRVKIVFSILMIFIIFGHDAGEQTILYLFSRYQLNWDIYKFSIYTTYSSIVNAIGCLFTIVVLSKWLGWDDSSLGIIAAVSKASGSIFTTFANTDFLMYMVPVISIVSTAKYAAIRSISSKLVPNKEIGKMNSLISLMETMGGLVFNPAYSLIYAATVEHFTAAVFVFTALTCVPLLGMLLWLFREHRRELKAKNGPEKLIQS